MTSPALSSQAQQFIDSVFALKPGIAVFDCDGTLWSGDAGRDFFYWEMDRGLIPPEIARTMRARYDDYLVGEVDEEPMCAEMVTMNAGIACDVLYRAAEQFFEEVVRPRIFPEMLELTTKLKQQGCELWAVSSTNNWVVEYGAEQFGIAARSRARRVRTRRERLRQLTHPARSHRRVEGGRNPRSDRPPGRRRLRQLDPRLRHAGDGEVALLRQSQSRSTKAGGEKGWPVYRPSLLA